MGQRLLPGSSLRRGDTIGGRYRVESLVRGGRAHALFGAVDTTRKMPVAIELLIASGEEADAIGLRFLAAGRRAQALESAHVARVLDAGVSADGHPYVVREWMRDRSLAELLDARGSIPTSAAIDIALDLCDALAEAHAHRLLHGALAAEVVHLDLSRGAPARVKLTGIGTTHATLALRTPAEEPALLRAPEGLEPGAELDPRADVWALGVVLHTMLAGASPFAADTPSGRTLGGPLDEPAQLAGVPDALADVVEACLARTPALRPGSIKTLAEELAPFGSDPIRAAARIVSRESAIPESSPTLVVGKTYDALRMEAGLGDADATAPRDALALDAIRAQAAPSLRDVDVDVEVEIEPSVRDVSKMPSAPPPPVANTVPPPPAPLRARDALTVRTRAPSALRRWQAAGAVAAAACLVVGVVAFLQEGAPKPAHRAAAASPIEEAPPPPAPAPSPSPVEEPAPPAPREAPIAITPASALPDSIPAAKPKPRPAARAPEPPAPAVTTPPAPAETPKPEPKASDDDLRRFLDDRR